LLCLPANQCSDNLTSIASLWTLRFEERDFAVRQASR
jgi:hypothetical protein